MDGGRPVSGGNRFLAFREQFQPQLVELKQKGVAQLRKHYDKDGLVVFDRITSAITESVIKRTFGKFFLSEPLETVAEQEAREQFVEELCGKLKHASVHFGTYESDPRNSKPHFGEDILCRLVVVLFWIKTAEDWKAIPRLSQVA